MNNSNRDTKLEDPIKEIQSILKRLKRNSVNWLISKLALIIGKGNAKQIVIIVGAIILIVGSIVTAITFAGNIANIKLTINSLLHPPITQSRQLSETASNFQPPVTPVLGHNAPESTLERERVKKISETPCNDIPVSIVEDFVDVQGKEKWVLPDEKDLTVISAPDNGQFQGTKRYPFECELSWIATISATPRKPGSIGLFVEYEDVIKVIIGDGDRTTWKVEKNDNGRREEWKQVNKQKLDNGKISTDKQFTVIIKALRNGKHAIDLELSLNYVPEDKTGYVWEFHKINNVSPKALNLDVNPFHKFRVGVNDWRFKGKGSELKLGNFSVKTLQN